MEQSSTSRHARLSARHIARLGELTKREIQVLCVLFMSRNGSSNRCDPRRKTIARDAGLKPPHVTIALDGLEAKGWILEMPEGGFHLFDADEIPPVEKSEEKPAKVTKSVTKKVTKLVTDVTESVTKSYQNGNSLNKELNNKENSKENKARAPIEPKPKTKSKRNGTRIPEPFELSDEMIAWCATHVPDLLVIDAHLDFVEYWTNHAENQKAYAINWRLRWEKGMRLLLKWQRRDAGIDGPPNPNCSQCGGDGRHRINDWTAPCEICQPNRSKRFWNDRGKRR